MLALFHTKERTGKEMEAYEALPWGTPEEVGMSAERLERIKLTARPLVDDGSHPW